MLSKSAVVSSISGLSYPGELALRGLPRTERKLNLSDIKALLQEICNYHFGIAKFVGQVRAAFTFLIPHTYRLFMK